MYHHKKKNNLILLMLVLLGSLGIGYATAYFSGNGRYAYSDDTSDCRWN